MARNPEFSVYLKTKDFFLNSNWEILCACPPGGTDCNHKKCLFPRTDPQQKKGPRDEVDMAIFKNNTLGLVECKPTLSDSLERLNLLGESDLQKLNRISKYGNKHFEDIFLSGYGKIIKIEKILLILSVDKVNITIPNNVTVLDTNSNKLLK
jgi:hypothetical protein